MSHINQVQVVHKYALALDGMTQYEVNLRIVLGWLTAMIQNSAYTVYSVVFRTEVDSYQLSLSSLTGDHILTIPLEAFRAFQLLDDALFSGEEATFVVVDREWGGEGTGSLTYLHRKFMDITSLTMTEDSNWQIASRVPTGSEVYCFLCLVGDSYVENLRHVLASGDTEESDS